jgi:hypothetical protein
MYAFHKWYFDIWNPPAEHCHCYLADVDLAGYRRCLQGVARSHPDAQDAERRQYLLAARSQPSHDRGIVTDQGHVTIEPHRVRAEFEVPGCRI